MEKFFDFYGALEMASLRLKESKFLPKRQEQMAAKLDSMRRRAKRLQIDIEKALAEMEKDAK